MIRSTLTAFILLAATSIPTPMAHALDDDADESIKSCALHSTFLESSLDALDPTEAHRCNEEVPVSRSSVLDLHLGDPEISSKAYFKSVSCSELFSNTPPDWLTQEAKEVAKTASWWPICSLGLMKAAHSNSPLAGASKLLDAQQWRIEEANRCYKKRLSYVNGPPETRQEMSKESLVGVINQVRTMRDEYASICCLGNDPDCYAEFEKMEIAWCPTESGKPTDLKCEAKGASYSNPGVHSLSLPTPFTKPLPWSITGSRPRIRLSHTTTPDGRWYGNFSLIHHEFGHACSDYQRRRMVRFDQPGNRSIEYLRAFEHWDENDQVTDQSACAVSDQQAKIYHTLFRSYGASEETFECLKGLSTLTQETGFTLGTGCPHCSSRQLEESFAAWMGFFTLPQAKRGSWVENYFCTGATSDLEHPPNVETLRCFLKTKSAHALIQRDLGCQ